MDKKILPENKADISLEFLAPRLVEAVQGWYIVFYQTNPATGELERERKSYNLGRVGGERERRKRGNELCAGIKKLLPMCYPWVAGGKVYELKKFQLLHERQEKEKTQERPPERTVLEALLEVTQMKCNGAMPETARTYGSRSRLIANWLTAAKLTDLPLSQFSRKHAQSFLDDVRKRVGNNTYNNYRREAITFWGVMVDREWVAVNPFVKTERLAKRKKKRRKFELDEATVVLAYLYENDFWLLVMVLLHLGGCLRRTEAQRLRFRDFHLKEGYILIDEERSKNHRAAPITLPEQVRIILLDKRFSEQPANWLLFGYLCRPHATISAGESSFKTRHRSVLLKLQKEGKLADITGLSLYSWKDTGMSALAKFLTPFELKDQARHADTATSMIYYQGEKLIESARKADLPMLKDIADLQRRALVGEGK